jgi:hypothetical protein
MKIEIAKNDIDLIKDSLEIVNYITSLMQNDKIEQAIPLIFKFYKDLPVFPKKLLTYNILEAHGQYDLRKVEMPEDFYDFLASHDSDDLFFKRRLPDLNLD